MTSPCSPRPRAFGRGLSTVAATRWSNATPCVDWDVADSVDDVVGGNRWAALVLQGVDAHDALATVRASVFGRDRVVEFATNSSTQLEAFSADGALAWFAPPPGVVESTDDAQIHLHRASGREP